MENITAFKIVLLLHILATVLWLGTVVAMEILGARIRKHGKSDEIVSFTVENGIIGRWVALPSALVVFLAGGWLMQEAGYKMAQTWWLSASVGLWIVAFLGSTMLRGPQAKKVAAMAKDRGADDEEVQWRARRILLLARGEILLVTVAVILMVIKPS